MFFLLSLLWFIRETKAILFYFFLWQLKEYHIGRFIDHFRTEQGKNLFLNKLFLFKIILIPIFFVLPIFFALTFIYIIYIAEALKTVLDLVRKRIKEPVLTKKTALLISASLLVEILVLLILFLNAKNILWFAFWLLVFDVLTPIIVSAIVLIFQPLAVLGRSQIIKKAIKKREQFQDLLVIGITGSYGKTSTKEFLATILSEKFKVLKTKEHQNSEVGISQCILDDLKPEHQIFVVEMGAYNRGGIKLLCHIAKPKIGILTGINEQHLATFGSQENIIKGKYELIESLPEDGMAFFNGKNKYCRELFEKTNIKKFLYGKGAKRGDEEGEGGIGLLGEENIEGAKLLARELGMTEEEINRASQKIENKIPGVKVKNGINGLKIIDATYSANPDGVMMHLEYLKTMPGKKIMVMPCLIELGQASKEIHKRIGQKISEVCDLAIITTKERFKEIKEGAIENGMNKENISFLKNPEKIFEKIKSLCRSGDIILLESRFPNELINWLIIK